MAFSQIRTDDFKKYVEKSKGIVVVDFAAEWSDVSKAMDRIVMELSRKHSEIYCYRIDVDKDIELADEYNVHGVPTLIFLKDGSRKGHLTGMNPITTIEHFIETKVVADN